MSLKKTAYGALITLSVMQGCGTDTQKYPTENMQDIDKVVKKELVTDGLTKAKENEKFNETVQTYQDFKLEQGGVRGEYYVIHDSIHPQSIEIAKTAIENHNSKYVNDPSNRIKVIIFNNGFAIDEDLANGYKGISKNDLNTFGRYEYSNLPKWIVYRDKSLETSEGIVNDAIKKAKRIREDLSVLEKFPEAYKECMYFDREIAERNMEKALNKKEILEKQSDNSLGEQRKISVIIFKDACAIDQSRFHNKSGDPLDAGKDYNTVEYNKYLWLCFGKEVIRR